MSELTRTVAHTVSELDQMNSFYEQKKKKESSSYCFIFESRSIMSSAPAVTFHQPACQAHSVQCAAKDSLSCALCVLRGVVFVPVLSIHSLPCIGKYYYGLAKNK